MKSGHGAKQPRKWPAAAAALLTTATIGEAATLAAVNERTLRRWMRDADFAAAIRAAGRELLEDAVRKLQGAATEAVGTLRTCLTAKRPADRIKAAVAILTQSVRGAELLDVLARLEVLEGGAK